MENSIMQQGPVVLDERSSKIFRLIQRVTFIRRDVDSFLHSSECPAMDYHDKTMLVLRIQDIADELEGIMSDCVYPLFDADYAASSDIR